jgi:hypothetical protein
MQTYVMARAESAGIGCSQLKTRHGSQPYTEGFFHESLFLHVR